MGDELDQIDAYTHRHFHHLGIEVLPCVSIASACNEVTRVSRRLTDNLKLFEIEKTEMISVS